ncbi:hypothetical protein M0R19_00685 [Candidatus Pacearchaeota archaeon]|jgi:hypothetical protein|nr:hypothetical protein [Candidatus Pacearchaeota archaeon]
MINNHVESPDALCLFLEKNSIHLFYLRENISDHFDIIALAPFKIKKEILDHSDLERLASCLVQYNDTFKIDFPYSIINGAPELLKDIFYLVQEKGKNLGVKEFKELSSEDFIFLEKELDEIYTTRFLNSVDSLVLKHGGNIK